jgi:hypothetical protein
LGLTENKHVSRMSHYLPFSPTHDQIYEEYQRSDGALNLETRALEYIKNMAGSNAQVIVLTGDAGHGKTHLCRRLLEVHLGFTEDEARHLINEKCDGADTIGHVGGGSDAKRLRIYKDFSELSPHLASEHVERAVTEPNILTVICANEGRLRAILEGNSGSSGCKKLLKEFRSSFSSGLASSDGEVHIVNLNYQSVAAQGGETLIGRTLRNWLDGRRWGACSTCDSRTSCPIYRNFEMLSNVRDPLASKRIERLEALFASAERLGAVITIREMLMIVAYITTGGLVCKDVHQKAKRGANGWQHSYAYYNVVFRPPPHLNAEQVRRIPILASLRRLDVGKRARRSIDESLINELGVFSTGQLDLKFAIPGAGASTIDAAEGIDQIIGNPRNTKERKDEADISSIVVRSLRRRAFFDGLAEKRSSIRALGFEYGDQFLDILTGGLSGAEISKVKSRILDGLHTIQGIQTRKKQTNLLLVDPAFGNATTHAAIISRRVQPKHIKLLPMVKQWQIDETSEKYAMHNALDWIDRHICLRVISDDESQEDFPLDLMMFDSISRASGGYIAESFYAHDIRKIMNFLARLTEKGTQSEGDISLFLDGEIQSVSIDEGVIQVGGAG